MSVAAAPSLGRARWLFYAGQRENRAGRGPWPPTLCALDETTNIAPLQHLQQILSTTRSAGVHFLTVWPRTR